MATSNTVNVLKQAIDKNLKHDRAALISRQKWGEMNFEDIRPEIEGLAAIAEALKAHTLESLPENLAQQLTNALDQSASTLEQINSFSVGTPNAPQQRGSMITSLRAQYERVFQLGAANITYLAFRRGDLDAATKAFVTAIEDAKRQTQSAVDEAKRQTSASLDEIKKGKAELEQIMASARQAAAATGAAAFATDFRTAANEYDGQSIKWLWAAIVIALITACTAALMWGFAQESTNAGKVTQIVTARLFILGLLVTATLWCGRTHRALKHLATVNRHRALSIQTFQAFSQAASDAQTKDAVLLEATRAVFGNVPTGYIEDGGDGDLKVLEIARSIVPGGRES